MIWQTNLFLIYMVDKNDLTDGEQLVLSLIYNLNKHFSKVTKLLVQKVFFLINRSLDDKYVQYEPLHYGMYSYDLEEMLEKEEDLGLINDKHNVTKLGELISKDIKPAQDITLMEEIVNSIKDLNEKDVTYLLYNLYPDFTKDSRIKEEVNSTKLESAVINLNGISVGESKKIKTDKNHTITVKKLSNNSIKIV